MLIHHSFYSKFKVFCYMFFYSRWLFSMFRNFEWRCKHRSIHENHVSKLDLIRIIGSNFSGSTKWQFFILKLPKTNIAPRNGGFPIGISFSREAFAVSFRYGNCPPFNFCSPPCPRCPLPRPSRKPRHLHGFRISSCSFWGQKQMSKVPPYWGAFWREKIIQWSETWFP